MRPPAAPLAPSAPVAPSDLAAVQAPQAHSARYASDAQAWVASVAYVAGQRSHDVPLEKLAAYLAGMAQRRKTRDGAAGAQHLLWLGLQNPGPALLTQVLSELGVSEKTRDEMLHVHQRPKVLDYGDKVLIVAITADIENGRPTFGETQYLIDTDFLLTLRRGSAVGYAPLRSHLERNPHLLVRGGDYVATELLDNLVDRYVSVASAFESVVELAEQQLISRAAKESDIRKLYRHRRDLLRIQTVIAPLAEICRRLAHVQTHVIDAQAQVYFSEVADRVARVDELLRALRESLAFAFEASLMLGQTAQNDITRKLAAWAAILAVPTAIAGIYGMNFEHMPELRWTWGYPLSLLVMTGICVSLYLGFRRARWL